MAQDPPRTAHDDALADAMHVELRRLLDAVPGARRALPYLAVLEQGFEELGPDILPALPTPALEKTVAQLAGVHKAGEGSALAQLVMLMRLELEDRAQRSRAPGAAPFLSTFVGEHTLAVSDATMSDFMRAGGEPPPR